MPAALRITTYNIHKGFSQFNRRMMVHELRDRLRHLDSDIVFLQEVQGLHLGHAGRHEDWPEEPQHEFLAEDVWAATAYGKNVIYDHGHHGNAILSRFPILDIHNQDVTHLQFERRGLLHCQISLPDGAAVHCVCVHLSLFGRSRIRQMAALADYLERIAPHDTPLIIAGDFNDWRNRADNLLSDRLALTEVFCGASGRPARSFPAGLPLFRLDRIYVRGFSVERAEVHFGAPWSKISDHAALSAQLLRDGA
ncbi:endonuclease/exonuclease/phosphatase family protein [Azospira restricta]|uniref:Endonuclease/exonuclease/phosphatase family protein n=1 Tax=Azospira restricta TaxID=404405 RepID=A0A974SPD3_9RHOO|nr:endonuclease/exonuclease/phosphatase family protein [Azospira restricta]QRJ64006.1 endonuclease/exonuclease/phosphatase family protein [Azospira restricta]